MNVSQIEWIGISATILVLISFLFSVERSIRIFNTIGALLFVIYGVLKGAPSVWILNAILILIHIIKMIKAKKAKKETQNHKLAYTFDNTQVKIKTKL